MNTLELLAHGWIRSLRSKWHVLHIKCNCRVGVGRVLCIGLDKYRTCSYSPINGGGGGGGHGPLVTPPPPPPNYTSDWSLWPCQQTNLNDLIGMCCTKTKSMFTICSELSNGTNLIEMRRSWIDKLKVKFVAHLTFSHFCLHRTKLKLRQTYLNGISLKKKGKTCIFDRNEGYTYLQQCHVLRIHMSGRIITPQKRTITQNIVCVRTVPRYPSPSSPARDIGGKNDKQVN